MKHRLTSLAAGLLVILVAGSSGAIDVGGVVDVDTTWTAAGSPYNVVEAVTVSPNVELTIQPGVTVNFQGSNGLTVNGVLTAVGNTQNPIILIGGAVGGQVVDASSRIFMNDASGASRVDYAVVSHFNNAFEIAATCTVEHSIIQQNQSVGVLVYANYDKPEPRIANNLVMHNDYGISLANSNSVKLFGGIYEYNTVVRNWTAGVKVHDFYGNCESITISHSILAFNGFGILRGTWNTQDIISDHTLSWRNAVAIEPAEMPNNDGISEDPWFVDSVMWNFQVMDFSPAAVGGADGEELGAYGNGGGLPANNRQYSTVATTSGALTSDERWSGVIDVTDTVTVPFRFSLVVEPGTTIRFAGDAGLEIWGVLFAIGSEDQMITLEGGGAIDPVAATSRIFLNGTPGESTVSYTKVGYFYDGLYTEESCNGACFINHNVIHDNQRYGLHLVSTRAGAHPVVVNNVVDSNAVGALLSQTASYKGISGTYEYNTFVDNVDQAFYLYDMYGSHTITVRNSIFVGNGAGIYSWGGGVSQIVFVSEYNDVWANVVDYGSYWGVVTIEASDISEDPMFVDDVAGDYHLQPGSPALTASSEGGEIGAYGTFPEPYSPHVFSDGFELGDLSGWS